MTQFFFKFPLPKRLLQFCVGLHSFAYVAAIARVEEDVRSSLRSILIRFGFQFIQIGNFRIGANDDDHFSVS